MRIVLVAPVLVALAVRARLGFGFSLTLVPLASLLIGFSEAVLLAIVLEVVSGMAMAVEHRTRLRLLDAALMKLCSLGGLLAGVLLRTVVSRTLIVLVSMTVVITVCSWLLLKGRGGAAGRSAPGLALAGVLSGFLNSWTSLSGPPIVIYYLRAEEDEELIKGALTGYFVLLYLVTFAALWVTGGYDGFRYWSTAAVSALVMIVCYPSIRQFVRSVRGSFDRMALLLIIASAFAVLFKEMLRF